ncbi:hypothetical protein EDD18DRAFT_1079807 [Armillaria luteobubalina]|uniref:Transmembrane protein n=1 Tax=Armillaria luteobubalina TaxID=153913 RepID=A0AA39TK04_9AGAR|nr:hypothetical protein EDD18DRAFT_1079807 [Armillaria luteobubalina]
MHGTLSVCSTFIPNAAGLLALAELSPITTRTSQVGKASYLDILVLLPGMQCQQSACDQSACTMNCIQFQGESTKDASPFVYPNMKSYLESIACPGSIVMAHVSTHPSHNPQLPYLNCHIQSLFVMGVCATLLYLLCLTLTVSAAVFLGHIQDWWGLRVLVVFMVSRLINVVVVRWRSKRQEVAREPNVEGDLLVLLSQNQWVHLWGMSDDLKIITSPQWCGKSVLEGFDMSFATLLVYATAVFSSFAFTAGTLTIASLLLCSSTILGLCNVLTECLQVFDCVVHVEGELENFLVGNF